ncbi:hypothetical protein BsWGS_18884 [Bradybaena similaris]
MKADDKMGDDDDVYTIEADIPDSQTYDAYLSSYRAYTGPQDGIYGVPLDTLSPRPFPPTEESLDATKTEYSDSSFIQYRPSSHRLLACISAFCCFCPVGIASLAYSCRAQCAKSDGDFGKAAILGKSAKDLAIASIVLGIVLLIILILVIVLVMLPLMKSG